MHLGRTPHLQVLKAGHHSFVFGALHPILLSLLALALSLSLHLRLLLDRQFYAEVYRGQKLVEVVQVGLVGLTVRCLLDWLAQLTEGVVVLEVNKLLHGQEDIHGPTLAW
mmetsp:Transcript_17679/g.29880  ORF Transcript_17679/g.29880 Transcript_17679/m.29880 type:complete len:110 (-) Transcript_17679:497-826(-)